jgi:uncharacterized alpha-E superfamily protein
MLNRTADSLYWLGRYVERAENVARIIDENLQLTLDAPPDRQPPWQPLVNATGDREEFTRHHGPATQENTLEFLTFDPHNPNSILSCLQAARRNARSLRDVISSEMWLQLNKFYLKVKAEAEAAKDPGPATGFFHEVRLSSHLFTGVSEATMTHDTAWHFLQIGRLIERADLIARILDLRDYLLPLTPVEKETSFDPIPCGAVLRSAAAAEMFGKQHGRISLRAVIDFLVLDPRFPRSIRFCLRAAHDSLRAVSGTPPDPARYPAGKLLGRICADLEKITVDDILYCGLHEYLDHFQIKLNQTAQAISETFFLFDSPLVLTANSTNGSAPEKTCPPATGVPV